MNGLKLQMELVLPVYTNAFDSIDRRVLFQKIRRLVIPHEVQCSVRDFLTDRYQRTKISNDCYSKWGHVSMCVPQGTKLGPGSFY